MPKITSQTTGKLDFTLKWNLVSWKRMPYCQHAVATFSFIWNSITCYRKESPSRLSDHHLLLLSTLFYVRKLRLSFGDKQNRLWEKSDKKDFGQVWIVSFASSARLTQSRLRDWCFSTKIAEKKEKSCASLGYHQVPSHCMFSSMCNICSGMLKSIFYVRTWKAVEKIFAQEINRSHAPEKRPKWSTQQTGKLFGSTNVDPKKIKQNHFESRNMFLFSYGNRFLCYIVFEWYQIVHPIRS